MLKLDLNIFMEIQNFNLEKKYSVQQYSFWKIDFHQNLCYED